MLWVALLAAAADAAVPSMMRAWYLSDYADMNSLKFSSHYPVPEPEAGEVLVEVRAASVNPIDYKVLLPEMRSHFPLSFPTVFGNEGAGVVVACGKNVSRLSVGDDVYYNAGAKHLGSYAEYHAVPESLVGLKPASLSFEEAAVLPLVTATSLQALAKLDRFAGIRNGTVLILGGSGGTGSVGLQLAKHYFQAARVITTVGAENEMFARSLGADEVIDYRTHNWGDIVANGSVDAVYDTVGLPGTAANATLKLKQDGAFATIVHKGHVVGLDADPPVNTAQIYVHMVQDKALADLNLISRLVESGKLVAPVEKVYPLEDLEFAWRESAAGHVRGKLAISLSSTADGKLV